MSNSDLRGSLRRGGFYWQRNLPYLSVTTILKIIDKPQLVYWACQQVYRAVITNPTIEEKKALAAPYDKSESAMSRGTTVHSIVEAYKNGSGKISTIEPFQGYADGFYQFIQDTGFYVTDNEKSLFSNKYRYAGTTDLKGHFNQNTQDNWLIDVKTGKDIYDEAGLQLSAYKQAEDESGSPVHRIGVLLLSETGKYKFAEMDYDFEAFLAAKKLYEWKNKDRLKKYGYL